MSDARLSQDKMVVLLTGMSGSGKSCFLKALEDLGYETIDNLPLAFLSDTVSVEESAELLAIGVDIRTRDFHVQDLLNKVSSLREVSGLSVSLVFLDCDVEVLHQRYRETRRQHPLSTTDSTLAEAIMQESLLLQAVRKGADHLVDTSLFSPPELKAYLRRRFVRSPQKILQVAAVSFAFPKGIPREADLVFDMRFLKNPHYLEDLRPLTGKDLAIQAFLKDEPDFKAFQEHLHGMLSVVLPRFKLEGRSVVTLAFGCTGGKHRSVFSAETIAAWLHEQGYVTHTDHRNLKVA